MKNLILFIALSIAVQSSAQNEIWTQKVSNDAFMSQLDDGKIFLKDKTKISLINNLTGEVEWENKVSTDKDPTFFEGVPFMYFEGKSYAVIDATSGKVIDQSSEKTEILAIDYFWEEGRIIVQMDRDKNLYILNMDLNDLDRSWTVEVGKVQKSFFGLASRSTEDKPSIADNGDLILVDKKYISLITPEGKVTQRIEYKDDIEKVGFNRTKNIIYILEDDKKLHFVDIGTGETKVTLELEEEDPALKVMRNGASLVIIQKKDLKILNPLDGSELGSHTFEDKIKKTYIEDDRYFLLNDKSLFEIDPMTAKVINETSHEKGFSEVYKVNDKVFISTSRGQISPIDLNTMKMEYSNPPRIPPVHDYLDIGDNVGYTYQIGPKFFLNVVNKKGEVVWDIEYNTPSQPTLDIVGNGLLIMSNSEVNYLSIRDGKSLWKDNVKVEPSFAYAVNEETQNMVMYSEKRLYFFDLANNTLTKSQEKFKFKDFDYETQQPKLFYLSDAVFLKGSNSIFVTDLEGNLKHENHYKRTSTGSTLLKLANVVVVAGAIGTGNGGKVVSVYSGGQQVHQGSMVDDLNGSWNYAEGLKAERQAKQNRGSSAFPYVYTKLESGKKGLIFIDPSTGEERFSVVMDEKDPNYIVDDVDGVLFHLSKTSANAFDIK